MRPIPRSTTLYGQAAGYRDDTPPKQEWRLPEKLLQLQPEVPRAFAPVRATGADGLLAGAEGAFPVAATPALADVYKRQTLLLQHDNLLRRQNYGNEDFKQWCGDAGAGVRRLPGGRGDLRTVRV